MKHDDVVTFFHEMGHAFHNLCSHCQYASQSGTNVAWDFVEAPSQMLENWCFSRPVLQRMSSHFQTGEKLPDDLIQKLIKKRKLGQGLFNLRQIFYGQFDLKVHSMKESTDFTALFNKMRREITLLADDGELTPGQSGFMHIMSGYDAGYYGYLYSQSFSADMFQSVFAKDPLDRVQGMHYRKMILEPGGSRDEMESLISFLGRPPTSEAFLDSLLGGGGGGGKL